MNAIVNGATRVQGGFRFDGTQGSGAQWPVQSQGQNQFYIFTKKQFTLAATVTIHSIQRYGDHLLLGASKDAAGTRVLIGLGYTQDNKWYVVDSNGEKMTTKVSFELEKEYHVAITFDKRRGLMCMWTVCPS
ncbi:hypothetical protein [Streptomyces hygroscopicus]|uniref:hypothetical protein n=1 Tax=Streptomyces hygroscopicus TaxID=1912 RepID=UPI003F1AC1DD